MILPIRRSYALDTGPRRGACWKLVIGDGPKKASVKTSSTPLGNLVIFMYLMVHNVQNLQNGHKLYKLVTV